jgi:thiol-disulfide isomerase/thioredoxin
MITQRLAGLLALGCATAIGCIQPIYEEKAAPAAKTVELPSPSEPQAVSLVIGDEQKLAAMLGQHRGKVVFVDFWATWCAPCVKSFPHTVATFEKYKDKDFATIAVSFDSLADEAKVRKFLAEMGARFENLLSSYDDAGPAVSEAFGTGPLPEFRLYDRSGKLRHKWTAKPQDLDARIEELLAEKVESSEPPTSDH